MSHNGYKTLKSITHFLGFLLVSVIILSACSSDSGNEASLDGDLRYQVEGPEVASILISYNAYTQSEAEFEMLYTITLNSSGEAEGDLPDGDYTGFQLQASAFGDQVPDITLTLLSDGDVLGSTSQYQDGVFIVEVGEIPDFNF